MLEFGSSLSGADKREGRAMSPENPINMIDIGCRWGFAERFLDKKFHRVMKVFGFDPDKEECARLQAFYKDQPEGYINCVPMGLAGKTGKRDLYVTKEPACSSLYPPRQDLAKNYPALAVIETEKVIQVDVITLEEWAQSSGLKTLDYIKVDTQGSELEILKAAGPYLDTVRCLDIEVEFNPIYEGQSLFWETDAYLREKGFVLWRLSNLVHYSPGGELVDLNEVNTVCYDNNVRHETKAFGGQLFWADARYVKSDIFTNHGEKNDQLQRDITLFEALKVNDISARLRKMQDDR